MLLLAALRWQIVTAFQSITFWLILGLVAASWTVLSSLYTLGLTTSSGPPEAALWQIAMIGTFIGAGVGLYGLGKSTWWMHRAGSGQRIVLEVATCFTFGITFLTATVLAALPSSNIAWPSLLLCGSLGALHASCIASLCCLLPTWIPSGPKVGIWTTAIVLFPFLWLDNGLASRTIRQSLGFAGYFEFPLAQKSPFSPWWTHALTLAGLLLLRWAIPLLRVQDTCATPSSETSTPI